MVRSGELDTPLELVGESPFTALPMMSLPLTPVALAAFVFCWASPQARGMIFFDTGDVTHNRETAPGGAWADSGWQYQGDYKNFLGTMISPRHFLTARHVGTGTSVFVHRTWFSGEAEDRVYFINPTVNSVVEIGVLPVTP